MDWKGGSVEVCTSGKVGGGPMKHGIHHTLKLLLPIMLLRLLLLTRLWLKVARKGNGGEHIGASVVALVSLVLQAAQEY